jgi:hypothetical protein
LETFSLLTESLRLYWFVGPSGSSTPPASSILTPGLTQTEEHFLKAQDLLPGISRLSFTTEIPRAKFSKIKYQIIVH